MLFCEFGCDSRIGVGIHCKLLAVYIEIGLYAKVPTFQSVQISVLITTDEPFSLEELPAIGLRHVRDGIFRKLCQHSSAKDVALVAKDA